MTMTNLEKLDAIASALEEMCRDVVFVGGAVVELYSTDPAAPRSRPTLDVDCVARVASRVRFHEFEEALRTKGFVNDTSKGAPICRWLCRNIQVDVMPPTTEHLGFANEWYEEGIRHTIECSTDNKVRFSILDAPYFTASKVSATRQRGMVDLRLSSDFEDIIYILRNRSNVLGEFAAADKGVRKYLRKSFQEFLTLEVLEEAIASVLDLGELPGTSLKMRDLMEQIGSLPDP
jgi:hypothetical protein